MFLSLFFCSVDILFCFSFKIMFIHVCVSSVVYLNYNLVALIVEIKHVAKTIEVRCQITV